MWVEVEVLFCIDHVWSSKECVYCTCDPMVYIDAPSIGFVCVCVCRKLSSQISDLDFRFKHSAG